MPIRPFTLVLAAVAIASSGCNRSVTLFEPTPVGQTPITEVLTGTVPVPVNAVFQSTFKTFIVGQGGGAVTVTLTSAVQTRPDGTVQTAVTMGLGAGTVVSGACVVTANAYLATPPGANPHLTGSLAEGTYCVRVSDVTGQVGPVVFAVTVTHT